MWNLQLVCGIPWWEQPDCLKFWLANLKLNINIFDPGYKFVENLKIVFNYFIKLPRVFIIIQNKTLRIASLNFCPRHRGIVRHLVWDCDHLRKSKTYMNILKQVVENFGGRVRPWILAKSGRKGAEKMQKRGRKDAEKRQKRGGYF